MRLKNLPHFLGVLALLFAFGSCDEDGETIVNTIIEDEVNSPPIITAQGPDFPDGGLDVTGPYSGPDLWVIVGDPDGLRDIAAVMLEVDSIFVNRVILRPDANTGFCAVPSYAANDTLAASSVVPGTFEGVQSTPLVLVKGGVYSTSTTYGFFSSSGPAFPDVRSSSSAFGPPTKGCSTSGDALDWWGVYTPVVPSDIDAFLTYADVRYQGITITVYDKEGEKAVATFPDLRIRYTSTGEMSAAP